MRQIIGTLLVMLLFAGCSTDSNPLVPVETGSTPERNSSHAMLGLWQFVADPVNETLEIAPLRTGAMHLNALYYLEPPVGFNLRAEYITFSDTTVECDVVLQHPFPGLDEYTGFDVCGILISKGSITGFHDSNLVMAGEGDTRLLNPDGYSRWWNPWEFPHNGDMISYIDGLMGNPDGDVGFNGTLNGYKYFQDQLGNEEPLNTVDVSSRGTFRAGQANRRHYIIDLGSEFLFNYAVDACWEEPPGEGPWEVPSDFPESANRAEPWNISITEVENTLYNDGVTYGGDLHLSIDVYDWFDTGSNNIFIEGISGTLPYYGPFTASSGGEGYSTYDVEIINASPQVSGEIDLLITIETEEEDFQGFIPGVNTSAYFTYITFVGTEAPVILDCGDLDPFTFSGHWEGVDWYESTVNYRSGLAITRSGDPYIIGRKRYEDYGTWIDANNGIRARKETGGAANYDYAINWPTGVACTGNIVSDSQNMIYFARTNDPSMVLQVQFNPASGFGPFSDFASIGVGWSIINSAVDENDNPVVLGRIVNVPPPHDFKVCHWNGTGWDEAVVPQSIYANGFINDFAYNPYNGQYVFLCVVDDGTGYQITNLVALDQNGDVVFTENDIFADYNHSQAWRPWMIIDPDSPDCHVVIWGCNQPTGFPTQNGERPVIRYDAEYGSKSVGHTSYDSYDTPWGDGAFAPGTNRLYTGNSIWTIFLTWFDVPSDW